MATKIKNEELQVIDYRYDEGIRGRVESNISPTLTTKASGYSGLPLMMSTLDTHTHTHDGKMSMSKELRIRKLTPKECLRLMGFTDEDYQALKDIGLSDSAIYHCAGDSIVTTCLVGILNPFVNEQNEHIKIIENYVEKKIIEKGD